MNREILREGRGHIPCGWDATGCSQGRSINRAKIIASALSMGSNRRYGRSVRCSFLRLYFTRTLAGHSEDCGSTARSRAGSGIGEDHSFLASRDRASISSLLLRPLSRPLSDACCLHSGLFSRAQKPSGSSGRHGGNDGEAVSGSKAERGTPPSSRGT